MVFGHDSSIMYLLIHLKLLKNASKNKCEEFYIKGYVAMQDLVILVDEKDKQIGIEEKLRAHQKGLLHRAFSIFIFNSQGQMLIHKRAASKYHSGGLWTNACCSHPRPGESLEHAAHRRLHEELGIDCPLAWQISFVYKVKFDKDNLFEHELDHVFFGYTDAMPNPNPEEVDDIAWVVVSDLLNDVKKNPSKYTYWFIVALEKVAHLLPPATIKTKKS